MYVPYEWFLSRVQEMTPQATLVEFIVTSASYHGVRRQDLKNLEDDLFRVFRNNVMPANAAAWYMARRRFYMEPKDTKQRANPLLAMLLKEYPKKFKVVDNVVHFLESYSPTVARTKMSYLVQQGLFAYFSHKADEYGVYFFDPLYYEETEPFHANLRVVTNLYNNQKTNKLIPAFFKRYKKQFHYKVLLVRLERYKHRSSKISLFPATLSVSGRHQQVRYRGCPRNDWHCRDHGW